MENDPAYRISLTLRKSVCRYVKQKSARTFDLIGCSPEELRQHLESLWQEGMSWDNYGTYVKDGPMTWHIDHIIPCDSFDLTNETEQAECFNYENLQPLWAVDNIRKSNNEEEVWTSSCAINCESSCTISWTGSCAGSWTGSCTSSCAGGCTSSWTGSCTSSCAINCERKMKSLNFNNLWRSFFDQYSACHNYLYRKFQVDHHVNLQSQLKTKYNE